MTHPDEGRLRALMDGELDGRETEETLRHLGECADCRDLSAEMEKRRTVVRAELDRFDAVALAGPGLGRSAEAKAAVLARIASERAGGSAQAPEPDAWGSAKHDAPASTRFTLARAASIALLLAVAVASALPASPVRAWLSAGWAAGWDRAAELFLGGPDEESDETLVPEGADPDQTDAVAGVRLDVGTGALSVVLTDIMPGTLLIVHLVDGTEAAVFAADPARFRTSDGRIEVTEASNRISVDLPRSLVAASIEANGRVYIVKTGDELDVRGVVVSRTPEEIRLTVQ